MSQCLNCKATLTCGCQKRVASDSKQCCTKCLFTYEQQLIAKRNAKNLADANVNLSQL